MNYHYNHQVGLINNKLNENIMFLNYRYISLLLLIISFKCLGEGVDQSTSCFAELKSKPEIQILKGKVDLGITDNPTLENLANNSKPTKREKAALSIFVSESENCVNQGEEWRSKNWQQQIYTAEN